MRLIIPVMCILGLAEYVRADCYPGDTIYTSIVQEIYHGVTSDNIVLASQNGGSPITRSSLCNVLTAHHNFGKNPPYQLETNKDFLGSLSVSVSQCKDALTYTQGYNSILGWQAWAGYHSGFWYSTVERFSDGAMWSDPHYESGGAYVVQPVRFDSEDRIKNCVTHDQTGATCRYGWNQSGQGVRS